MDPRATWRQLGVLALLSAFTLAEPAAASVYDLSYGGRLTTAAGAPVEGPVRLDVKFFRAATGGEPLPVTLAPFEGVALHNGLFQITIDLSASDFHTLFNGSDEVWLEVSANGAAEPRQRFSAVPYALKVPVDGTTIGYNGSGQLTYLGGSGVTGVSAAAPLTVGGTASAPVVSLPQAGAGSAGYLSAADWTAFNGKQASLGYTPVNKAGDTMTGALSVLAPTAAAHATPKSYVDAMLGGFALDQSAKNDQYVVKWDTAAGKFVLGADQLGAAGGGIQSINTLNATAQTLAVGTSGTAPAWVSATSTHTLNIPLASAAGVTAGLIAKTDYDAFTAKQPAITGTTPLTTGAITATSVATSLQNGVEVKPFGTTAGNTGEVRFDELTANGTDYVGFKAPDAVAAPKIWILPAADGTSGQVLKTDGAGNLGWASQPAVPVTTVNGQTGAVSLTTTNVAEGTSLYYTDARARLALSATAPVTYNNATGAIGVANATTSAAGVMSGADKTSLDGLVTNALVDGDFPVNGLMRRTAAGTYDTVTDNSTNWTTAYNERRQWDGGATNLNAATARTSLGLGSLATLGAVGSSEITDNTIVDADINASAAIAQSKISGLTAALAAKGDVFNGGQTGALTLGTTNATALTLQTNNAAAVTVLSGGNVGIGSTAPGQKLTVAGTIESTTGGFRFPDGTVQTTSAASGTNNTLIANWPDIIQCSGANGNVALHLSYLAAGGGATYVSGFNSGAATDNLFIQYTAAGAYLAVGNAASWSSWYTSCVSTSIASLYAAGKAYNIVKGPAAQWLQTGSSAYYNAGSVGIGTTLPGTALDVAGAISERGMTAPAQSPAGQGRIYFDSAANKFMVSENGGSYAQLATGGTVTSVTAGTGLSGGTITGTGTIALANTAVSAGSYTRVNITVDAQGRLTAAANGASVNLASEVTGTLPVANGGTGAATAATNLVFAAPNGSTGAPSFRALAAADVPSLTASKISDFATATAAAETDPKVGANTTGYHPKWNGTALVAGSIYDNGSIGIGTSVPAAKLHIVDNGAGNAPYVTLDSSDTSATWSGLQFANGATFKGGFLRKKSSDDVAIWTAGSTSLPMVTVQSGGNVGIGSNTPGQKLTVAGTIESTTGGVQFPDSSLQASSPNLAGGRLTVATGIPVTSGDLTTTTLYYAPYVSDQISLYDGTRWRLYTFTERSLSLASTTANTTYDVFLYDNAGTLTLELLAWSTDTARATSLTRLNGVLVKNAASTRRYLGTIRTTTAGTTEDSKQRRLVWNNNNRVTRVLRVLEATDTWNYSTGTFRAANGSAANRVETVVGVGEEAIRLRVMAYAYVSSAAGVCPTSTGIGLNSTTTPVSGQTGMRYDMPINGASVPLHAEYEDVAPLGYNFWQWLEYGCGSGTTTFIGDNGSPGLWQSGIYGETRG